MGDDLFRIVSEDYMNRMAEAIWRAILETGKIDGGTTVLMSGEIIKALLLNISVAASTSEAVSTPKKRREFCEAVAQKLRYYLNESREEFEKGTFDFMAVRPAKTN